MRLLLDLAIARLPFRPRIKARLALSLQTTDDLRRISAPDLAAFLYEKQANSLFGNDKETQEALPSPEKLASMWEKRDKALAEAEKDAVFLERRGMGCLSIAESTYPLLLKTIYDPPAALFYRGDVSGLTNAAVRVAIVGTRKPGAGVPTWTYAIARNLAAAGVPIVSGLAIGIDAQAHRGAVDAGAPTYAVLGSAVDEVFPHSNRVLAARIVEKGGALVSEYPPGVLPQKWHFPARNRIISGLCAVTLVAAAPEKSGALITAGFAAEQNRDVWVGGGPEPFGEGCERLAFDGAKVITGIECALAELGIKAAAPESAQKDNAAAPSSALAGSLARELGISF